MSQAPNDLKKIRSLANSILRYADQCEKENPSDISTSEQGKQISAACSEMASLAASPRNWVIRVACGYIGSMAFSLVLELGLHRSIAEGETTTSLDDLAQRTNASKQIIKSAMRQCVLSHIFEEPTLEHYRHNENSRMLLNENYASWVHFRVDESFRSGAHLCQSIAANNFQVPDEPQKTAFGLAFQTDKFMYEYYYDVDQARGARFAKHMAASLDNNTYGVPVELVFSFEKLKPDATVVDVGGGIGQNSIRLANRYPGMSFIVQDLYSNADTKWSHLPAGIRNRLKWQAHDFHEEQPVKGADLYLISQILMDHQRGACREILKHIVEAMIPNHSVLLISDFMSPTTEGNFSLMTNQLNLHMMAILGRAFWTRMEWEDLFASVSASLKLQTVDFEGGRAIFELVKQS